jgi:hypothetical protein
VQRNARSLLAIEGERDSDLTLLRFQLNDGGSLRGGGWAESSVDRSTFLEKYSQPIDDRRRLSEMKTPKMDHGDAGLMIRARARARMMSTRRSI